VLGDSPSSDFWLDEGAEEGDTGALEVGVGGATGEAAILSSESLCEDPLLWRPPLFAGPWWGVGGMCR